MPCEFRMRYLLSVKYHNIQQRGSLQSIIFKNVFLRNNAITWHWNPPDLQQRLFEKQNKIWAAQCTQDVTRRCVCLFNTLGSSVHSSKILSNKTISKKHNNSSALTVSNASHMVNCKCQTAQQQICSADFHWKSRSKALLLNSWDLPQRLKSRWANWRYNCKSGAEIH